MDIVMTHFGMKRGVWVALFENPVVTSSALISLFPNLAFELFVLLWRKGGKWAFLAFD